MLILLFNRIHQTPHGPRHKQFACVAQLVQQSPCKRSFVGSIPITGLNSSGVKSWGRRLALGASSGTFESFTPGQLVHDSSEVERSVVNRDVAGSIPARAELWMSSSSLRREVVGIVTRARIPSSTPSACPCQLAERDGLPFSSEIKSPDKHHASVVQLAETTVLEAVRCKFESCQGHQCVDRLIGKPTASKAVTLCSNHSQRAMLVSSSGPGHSLVRGKIEGSNPFTSANGVEPIGRKRFAKPPRRKCLLGSNPSYSETGDDPNWKGSCFENRYAERLAGSSPCHLRQFCQGSNGGPCGRLKSG